MVVLTTPTVGSLVPRPRERFGNDSLAAEGED